MPGLNFWAEQDTVPQSRHAVAQFDIFHTGRDVLHFVESAAAGEHSGPHSPTASPEGHGFARIALMHVSVEQVPVLADQSFGRRGEIICPEYRTHTWRLTESLQHSSKCVGMDANVGIHEHEGIASGHRGSAIARERWTVWPSVESDDPVGILSRYLSG
jgi:hypothetical protein